MINKKNIRNLILSDIDDYLVLFEDTANIESLETEYTNEYRFFSDEAKSFIEENFLKEQKKDKSIVNYDLFGLRNFETYGGKIFISFEKGDYKTYLASKNKAYKKFIAEKNFFIIPISITSIITTKDNKILTLVDKQNKCILPSGIIKEEDVNGDNMNILNCINRTFKNMNLELFDSKIIGIYKSKNSCIIILNQKTDKKSTDIENTNFLNNNVSTLGKIIQSGDYLKRTRQAFKFHLKENFNNYDYINVKLK